MSDKKIPENYFDQLPNRIMDQLAAHNGESDALDIPNIDAISKVNMYKVPESYFSTIIDRDYGKHKVKYRNLITMLSIAASLLIVIIVLSISYMSREEDYLSTEDAIAYYIDGADIIDEELYIDISSIEETIVEDEDELMLTEILSELSYAELEELQSEIF